MSNTILADIFKANLFELMDETVEQVQGRYLDRGTALFETLATISAGDASQPVSAQCASLAAQVEHITFYLEVTEHYLLGKEDREWDWKEIWRTVKQVTPEEWAASQNRLRETVQRLRALMDSFDAWDKGDRLGHALNLLVHTAFHLGQIRQSLCTIQPNR
jgi:hypothetical protein